MKPRHIAIASGLALTLTFGAVQATTAAFAEPSASADADAAATGTFAAGSADSAADDSAEQLPAPADYDKADFYESAPAVSARSARSASSSSLSSVSVSSEMKYFTKYESHSNYRQGFSYGDGYNALGYYQFDRRYSLIPFLTQVYNANPTKYSMLKAVIDRGSEVKSASSMYDSGSKTLTELGQLVQSAWYAAYDADPAEFSAFQDAYAYNSYYVPTERWLKSELGIDMSGRADCVKGMVWGLSNMWGTGGVKKVLRGANLSNDMTDREFVTALSAQMTDNIEKYSSQTQYYKGWKNRYKNELNDCLAFISLHEAEDEAAGGAAGSTDDATNGAADDSAGDAGGSAGDAGAGSGSDSGSDEGAGDSTGSGSNSGTAGGSNDGASGSGSNGAGSAGDSAGSGSGSADDAPSNGATAGGDTAGGSGGSSSNSGRRTTAFLTGAVPRTGPQMIRLRAAPVPTMLLTTAAQAALRTARPMGLMPTIPQIRATVRRVTLHPTMLDRMRIRRKMHRPAVAIKASRVRTVQQRIRRSRTMKPLRRRSLRRRLPMGTRMLPVMQRTRTWMRRRAPMRLPMGLLRMRAAACRRLRTSLCSLALRGRARRRSELRSSLPVSLA